MAELGVAYLPATISSDAGYADLPLALLGAPVDIGALVVDPKTPRAKQDFGEFRMQFVGPGF